MILITKSLTAHIFMNKMVGDPDKLCKQSDDMSSPFEGFNENKITSNHFFYQLQFPNTDVKLPAAYINFDMAGTGVVRLGDLNLDGYQDLAITISDNGKEPRTYFFSNTDCSEEVKKNMNPSGDKTIDFAKCRYFGKASQMSTIESVNTYSTSFFDYHELG